MGQRWLSDFWHEKLGGGVLLIKVARLRGNGLGRRCKRQALTASQFAWEDPLPGLRVGVGLGLSGELLFTGI